MDTLTGLDREVPNFSESFQSSFKSYDSHRLIELFYKLKYKIDSINRKLNLQNNIVRLVELNRRNELSQDNSEHNNEKFERNYRYWRRKLRKLKNDQKSKTNIYDILYEFYRSLLKNSVDTDNESSQKEEEDILSKSLNVEQSLSRISMTRLRSKAKVQSKIIEKRKSICRKPVDKLSKLYQCRFCPRKVNSKRALSSHASQAHKDQNIHFCDLDECSESYSTPALLRQHKIEHHHDAIECKKCHKFFKNRNVLVKHRKSVHRNSCLECSVGDCSKTFSTKRRLEQHLKECHNLQSTKDPKVSGNNRRDSKTGNKTKGIKSYSNDPKPSFQCTKCSRTFTKAFNFKTHLKAVDCTKVWCCHVENCPEMFPKLKLLTAHCLGVHQESVKFRCNWPGCTYLCNLVRGLKSHYRVHTGERPYLCNWPGCDKTFKTTSSLSDHRKQHKNELKYSCTYPNCTYKANTNCTMRSHIRIRHEKKYYKKKRKLQITDPANEQNSDSTIIVPEPINGLIHNSLIQMPLIS